MNGNLFIVSSPSGGGKGTLIKEVLKNVPNTSFSVSYTTRKKREGEIHGKNYFFVSSREFKDLIERDEFLEYAEVHGNFYGTSRSQVEKETKAGNDIILEIDVQGAETIREKIRKAEKMPRAVSIFILPPSYEVLERRLRERKTESEAQIKVRLNAAVKEVRHYEHFDYVVINERLREASEEMSRIFLAERQRTDRQKLHIRDILKTFDK